MEKSALQKARAAYQPKLPKALQGAVKVKEGAATQSVGDQDVIKKLFPNTYGMLIVEFEPATEANTKKMNVGIILSGGQALRPGQEAESREPRLWFYPGSWRSGRPQLHGTDS